MKLIVILHRAIKSTREILVQLVTIVKMDFYLFRASLKQHVNLFARQLSREEWLREAFSVPMAFSHRQEQFIYIPEKNPVLDKNYIYGWIGRSTIVRERTSPEDGFLPTEHESWRAAFIAMDPSHHDDGQKIAMEFTSDVGRPGAILKSLFERVNQPESIPYVADVHAIVEQGSFWSFVRDSDDRIKSISFELAAPNMFGGKDDMQQELRALRDNENVSKVKTTLISDTSLNPHTQRMTEVVNYAEQGGGALKARNEAGKTYNSDDHASKVDLPVETHKNAGVESFIGQIAKFLDRIF